MCVGTLLRMGCDSFLMPVRGSVGGGEPLWEQNGLPWEHSSENQWGETDRKTNSVGGKERSRDRKPNLVACSARIVSGWVDVA